MPIFKYKGKNKVGTIVSGERSARTPQEVINALEKEQIQILNIERKAFSIQIPFLTGKGMKKKVNLRDLSVFNRQLGVMFNAGLPVTQGLTILATQQKNKYFSSVISSVRKDVEAGSNLSNAMKKYPLVFNELYTSMIQAGEASGNLDTILLRLSQYIESMQKLVSKVKSALAYPIAVLIIAVIITAIILTKVVPIFEDMFRSLGASLPLPTQIVVDASQFLRNNFFFIVGAIVAGLWGLKAYGKTFKGRRIFDRIKLKLPIFGVLLLKTSVARVTRTMETLLNAGVEIIEAMTITAKTSANAIVEDAVLKSRASVQEGKPLGESWEDQKIFPFMVTQMVMVGEQTGALSSMLAKVADFYDDEVQQTVDALVSLMEPVLILVLGTLVGGIIIAMYMPMFDIIGKIG